MKRPESRNGREATSHPRGAWFWAASVCGLFAFVAGCTGKIGAMASGSAGASNPAGTGNSAGSGSGGAGRRAGWRKPRHGRPGQHRSRRGSVRDPVVAAGRRAGGDAPGGAAQPAAVVERRSRPAQADGHLGHRQRRHRRRADGLRQRSGRAVRHRAAPRAALRRVGEAGRQGHRRRDRARAPRARERAHGHGREGRRRSSPRSDSARSGGRSPTRR